MASVVRGRDSISESVEKPKWNVLAGKEVKKKKKKKGCGQGDLHSFVQH